jgi:DNA-binding beta-propeller fold protein YncE
VGTARLLVNTLTGARTGRGSRIRRLGCAGAVVTLLAATGGEAFAAPLASSLVNTIQTSAWSPPSPDPSGIGYDSTTNRLLVTDGEVEEMSIWKGANYYEATLAGTLLRTASTTSFSDEPVGVTFSAAGKVFISDDDERKVFDIALGSNGLFDASDGRSYFSTSMFGSRDPEGVAYDRAGNRLFIADGEGSEIYEVDAIDAVFGNSNDVVRHFDTGTLGVSDPETVEFNPASGTLFTIGKDGNKIVETTTGGVRVSEIDTAYLPLDKPAGLVYAPNSRDATKTSFYICDRKVDNNDHSSENDGAIYEVTTGSSSGGTEPPPPPSPTGDIRITSSSDDAEEAADGSVSRSSSDLELIDDGGAQTVGLRFPGLAIPAGATITNAYIQFVADESQSESTNLSIRAQAAGDAATFGSADFNISSRLRTIASVPWSPAAWSSGEVGSDTRTPDLTSVVQEIVSRPNWQSGNAIAFIITGSGHRTAESKDGSSSKAPLLHYEYR